MAKRKAPQQRRSVHWRVREQLWRRDQKICPLCLASIRPNEMQDPDLFTVDHIRPRSHGGGSELSNLQLVCRQCNLDKADYCSFCPDRCSGPVASEQNPNRNKSLALDRPMFTRYGDIITVHEIREQIWRSQNLMCLACEKDIPSDKVNQFNEVVALNAWPGHLGGRAERSYMIHVACAHPDEIRR